MLGHGLRPIVRDTSFRHRANAGRPVEDGAPSKIRSFSPAVGG